MAPEGVLSLDTALGVFSDPQLAEYARYAVEQSLRGRPYDLEILAAMEKYPVSIEDFVLGEEYLGMQGSIYPEVLKSLVELNNPSVEGLPHRIRVGSTYSEAVLTGAIGVAKSTIAIISTAYQLYVLSCLNDPQAVFGIDPSSEILFVFQSVNAALAKQVDYERFKALIEGSPYFCAEFPFDKGIKSELRFPNRVIVRPVSGRETATIGQNVFGGIIDEVNFMEVVQRSKRSVDGDTYDQAIALYNSIARRRKSRFMKRGRLPGLLCLVSSKRYPGQFTDQKVDEARKELAETGSTSIYVYDKRTWDIKPAGTFSGEWFRVFQGDQTRKPRVVEPGEDMAEADRHLLVDIPAEYRQEFETDIMKALRDIAGVSTLAVHPFMMDAEAVSACFGARKSILSRPDTDFDQTTLRLFPRAIQHPDLPRFAHVDLALSGDSAGVVVGHVPAFVSVPRGGESEILPKIVVDFALEVRPPKGGEIPIGRIRGLFYKLREQGMNLRWISFDGFQSADSIQTLRAKGFVTGTQSVDRKSAPYEITKMALYDRRVEIPQHPKLLKELISLEKDAKTGKVDHPVNGSKDIADGLAGVVYGLTMRREVWVRHGVPPVTIPPSIRECLREDADN
jgi:hypothetical protein